jgi:hypothetical protein
MSITGRFEDSVIEVHPLEEEVFKKGNLFIEEIKKPGSG